MQFMYFRPIPLFFFFNDTATTEIYTLSLHDALPISDCSRPGGPAIWSPGHPGNGRGRVAVGSGDRKSTRLNSSHSQISYAVFCLKKKKNRMKAVVHTHHLPQCSVSDPLCILSSSGAS